MKLTGKLKTQVESAATKEEKREAIKQAGMLLSDDKLEQVAGGRHFGQCSYWPVCRLYGTSQCLGDQCLHVQEAQYEN